MKNAGKSKGVPLDRTRLARLKDPKRMVYTVKLALKEYEKDHDVDSLLDTLRLVVKAQGIVAKVTPTQESIHTLLDELRVFRAGLKPVTDPGKSLKEIAREGLQ